MTSQDQDAIRQQLIDHEGLRLRAYLDSVGKTTIGVGRNLIDRGITTDEAMLLLDHDIAECLIDLRSFGWFSDLDAVRQRALTDLRFNLGPYRFRSFVKMLDALARQDYPGAATELALSEWIHQVQPKRATRLIYQLRTGKDTA